MSTEWNITTLKAHFDALREADQHALKIKEEADRNALVLAREIQAYKDEKANELREQINGERGLYATKEELAPIVTFVAAQQGSSSGKVTQQQLITWIVMLILAGLTIASYLKR